MRSDAAAQYEAWQTGLSLCRAFRAAERLAFAACAGGQLGITYGQGRGLAPNRSSSQLLAQTGLEGAVSLRLFSSVALRTSAAAALALAQPTFFGEDANHRHVELFQAPLIDVTLRAGLVVDLR